MNLLPNGSPRRAALPTLFPVDASLFAPAMSALTASPFHPATGQLLPVYRTAYLFGDLAPASMAAVTEYLRTKPDEATAVQPLWEALQAAGEIPAAIRLPWVAAEAAPVALVPDAAQGAVAAAAPGGARRWRLPGLRLFGLIGGLGLVAITTYGLSLVQQQQQADQAGPVFQRTEYQMEATSVMPARAYAAGDAR